MNKIKKFPKIRESNALLTGLGYEIKLIVSEDREQVKKFLEYYFDEENEGFCVEEHGGKCFIKDNLVPIVWVPRKPKTTKEIGTLTHELGHALMKCFQFIDIKHTEETDEVWQHSIGYLVDWALTELKVKIT